VWESEDKKMKTKKKFRLELFNRIMPSVFARVQNLSQLKSTDDPNAHPFAITLGSSIGSEHTCFAIDACN